MSLEYWDEHPEKYGAKEFLELRYAQMVNDLKWMRNDEDKKALERVLDAIEKEIFKEEEH